MNDKIKVLLVEDEASLAMIMKDTMEPTGMSVTLAADGEEGLCAFFAEKPDVLVTDVMMPRMDGFEMVRRIREHDKLTPVLFLTARSSVNDVVDGFKMGGDDYLKKPFSLQELMVRVRRLAERQDSTNRLQQRKSLGVRMLGWTSETIVSILSPNNCRGKAMWRNCLTVRPNCCGCWLRTSTKWWNRTTSLWRCGATTRCSMAVACRCLSPSCAIAWSMTHVCASSMCVALDTSSYRPEQFFLKISSHHRYLGKQVACDMLYAL